jgi:23S rRNA (guanosine2251-2'-O)-methyltransferase
MILNGVHEIMESLRSGKVLLKIVASEHRRMTPDLMQIIKNERIPLVRLNELAFRKKYPEAKGIVGILEEINLADLDELMENFDYSSPRRILLIDEINDPQNVGAMIRSCVCFDFHAVVMTSRNTAPLSEGVVNASSGSCFHIPVARVNNMAKCIEMLKKNDFWIIGTSPGKGQWVDKMDLDRHLAVVMGNEQKGVRPKVLNYCDYQLSIPMKEGFDSLNVSVAFGILACYLFNGKR